MFCYNSKINLFYKLQINFRTLFFLFSLLKLKNKKIQIRKYSI